MRWIAIGTCIASMALAGCGGEDPGQPPADSAAGTPPAASAGGPSKVDEKEFKSLDGGLKYAVLKSGTGAEAKPGSPVSVHYTGWLKDGGKKFDSSLDRGEPFEFTLGQGAVIKGWDEGVKGMKVGEKRQLVIPAELGYGATGSPPDIPPGATLVFDVELLKVGG